MKILILTGKFGMGHYSASLSLRQQLLRAFPQAEVDVEDLVAYAMPNVSKTVYQCFNLLVTRGSGLFNMDYKLTENAHMEFRPAFEPVFLDALEELLTQRRPDAVVATHPMCAQLVSRYKKENGSTLPLVTCVTDLSSHSEWITSGTDCYLVGSNEIGERLGAKVVERSIICVTGIPVRSEFKRPVQRRAGRERHLLIMGGGLGLLPRRDKFYEQLNALPGVKTTLITGNNRKLYERLAGKYQNIEVLGYTDRVYDYMARADLALTKPGGITLFETIFSELPILAWEPFLQQEKNNARFLVKRGLGRVAAKEPEACLAAIRALIYDDEALESMARNMRDMKGQLEEQSLGHILSALAAQRKEVCA